MHQDEQKALVAKEAVNALLKQDPPFEILGIGTGSTVNLFIDALAPYATKFKGVVSSSQASTERLLQKGFTVLDANDVMSLDVYIDGADEINPQGIMLKGGGGALTREKIVASMAKYFICICDSSKQVVVLGKFPLPIEVIPLASQKVTQYLEKLGGVVSLRKSKVDSTKVFVTDNSGWILDISGLHITHPQALEVELNQIPGVICNGIFAQNKAQQLIVSSHSGVETIRF
jgi:ribose 5-phosphate isomerase A